MHCLQCRAKKKKRIRDPHVRLDNCLVRLGEHEVRNQDVEKRFHLNQRETLAYAGLVRQRICQLAPHTNAIWPQKTYAGASRERHRVGVETR